MKTLLFTIAIAATLFAPATASAAARDLPSTKNLDRRWGAQGLQLMPRVGQSQKVNWCEYSPDGSLLMIGASGRYVSGELRNARQTLTKFTPSGKVDRHFSRNGVLESLPIRHAFRIGAAGDAAGRTYVVVRWKNTRASNDSFRVIRLTRSGRLDASWGSRGVVTVPGKLSYRAGVAVEPSASGLVLRFYKDSQNWTIKFDPSGKLTERTDTGRASGVWPSADGGWYSATSSTRSTGTAVVIKRFTKGGLPVTTWAENGAFTIDAMPPEILAIFGAHADPFKSFYANNMGELVDGSFSVAVTYWGDVPGSPTWGLRLDPNGKLDRTFGDNGYAALGQSGAIGDSGGDRTGNMTLPLRDGRWVNTTYASLDMKTSVTVSEIPALGSQPKPQSTKIDLRSPDADMEFFTVSPDTKRVVVCGWTIQKRPNRFTSWALATPLGA